MRRYRQVIVLVLYALTLSIFSPIAKAEEIRLAIAQMDRPPYYYRQEGIYHGILPDLFAQFKEVDIKYIPTPRKRVDLHLRAGRIDMVVAHPSYLNSDKFLQYIPLKIMQENHLFSMRGRNESVDDIAHLRNSSVCTIHGYIYNNLDHRWQIQDLRREDAANEDLMLRMLVNDRCDYLIGSNRVMRHKLRELDLAEVSATDIIVSRDEAFLAVHKRLDAQIDYMRSKLSELHQSGKMQAILSRYE